MEPRDELEHGRATGRVEPVGRLIENDQVGIVDERLGKLGALTDPGRLLLDETVARLLQPQQREHLVGAAARIDSFLAAQLAGERNKLQDREPGDEAVVLRHIPHP